MNKVVLVTGGAGYIGSHTCKCLYQAGLTPVTYDNLSTGSQGLVRWGHIEIGDINDKELLKRAILKHRPYGVIHLAACTDAGESVHDPMRYYHNNVSGTLAVIDAMRECGVMNLVFSSTAAVYGHPERNPVSEDCALNPINPYGRSKMICEMMIKDIASSCGMGAVVLRYFNAAGADPECEAGESRPVKSSLIPRILDAASGGLPFLEVYGDDYNTPDGTCLRDYVHVSDIASAHLKALQLLDKGIAYEVFNLGAGRGYSVIEIINAAKRVTGRDIPYRFASRREGDPESVSSLYNKAVNMLNWEPKYQDIDAIISHAWQWHLRGFAA